MPFSRRRLHPSPRRRISPCAISKCARPFKWRHRRRRDAAIARRHSRGGHRGSSFELRRLRASIARRPFLPPSSMRLPLRTPLDKDGSPGLANCESRTVSREPRAASREPRATSREPRAMSRPSGGDMSSHRNGVGASFGGKRETYVSQRRRDACRPTLAVTPCTVRSLPRTARRAQPIPRTPHAPAHTPSPRSSARRLHTVIARARTKKSPRARARGDFFGLSQLPDDSGKPHAVLTLPRPSASSAHEPSRARWPASPGTSAQRP